MKIQLPAIFDYDDYRLYLRDWMEAKAASGPFSARWFARKAGFKAENMMHLVMGGKRNLSRESIRKFIHGLSLGAREAEYFEDLVGMNQASTHEERLYYYERLIQHPGRRKIRPMEQSQLAFFQHWAAPVIYEMVKFADFRPDAHWIAEQLTPEPPLGTVKSILKHLVESGLVVVDGDGKWSQASTQIHSGDDVQSVHLYSYHEQALEKAADALHEITAPRRHFHVLTTAIANELMPELVELTQKYEAELWSLVEKSKARPNQVVQVGLHIFPSVQTRTAPRLRKEPGEKPATSRRKR